MNNLHRLLAVASAAFFITSAQAQNAGTVTSHAFAVGKGAGITGYTSVLCTAAQLAVGQSAADPICKTITGDVTITSAGVTAIGATKVTSADLNADVFSTAHSWGGTQTFTAPVLGTPASGTLTNATGLPISSGVSGLGTGCATFLGTPSSANLRGCLTDEVGTGAAYFVGGALGTPASATLTNATGLPLAGHAAQNAFTFVGNNTSGSASPTAVDIALLTSKASPASTDLVMISDQAASGAWKKVTVSSLASAGSVASLNTLTGTLTLLTQAQGRLTLQANTPVMTTTNSAQTTLRYDCYIGNQVPYYTGSADAIDTIASCEVTDAMVSAASAGQVISGQVYDVWWVHSGASRICLAMSAAVGGGGGWASDTAGSNTARGTGYSQLDRTTRPYTTNKNSITNCFNAATNYGPVSANQGTYLGTVAASANGQISWTYGALAAGGTAGTFGVWNMNNRVSVSSVVQDSTTTAWNYNTATPRASNGSSAMRITYVSGLADDEVYAEFNNIGFAVAGTSVNISGVCHDSTSTFSGVVAGNGSGSNIMSNSKFDVSDLGLHFMQACEAGNGSAGNSSFGNVTTFIQNGLTFRARM